MGDETAFRYILLGIQPTDIQLDESEVMLYLNREGEQEKTLTAQILPENVTDKTVIWESDNEKVAVVDSDGKVTAKSMGQAKITASIGGKRPYVLSQLQIFMILFLIPMVEPSIVEI